MYVTNLEFAGFGNGLGSQMSQYAALYTVSKHTGHDIWLFEPKNIEITEAFDIKLCIKKPSEMYHYTITTSNDINNIVESNLDPSSSWDIQYSTFPVRFWDETYRKEICEMYTFKSDVYNESKRQIESIRNEEITPLVSLDVKIPYTFNINSHVKTGIEYYKSALSSLKGEFKLVIFTDDMYYCKRVFHSYKNVHYVENNTSRVDMCMMSLCDHNIVDNNNFSFWGAYLNKNPNKRVVCPAAKFLPGDYFSYLNGYTYPKDWNPNVFSSA